MDEKVKEISIYQLVTAFKELLIFLRRKWLIIITSALIGALCGLTYSILKKPVYTAVTTFVLDESNKSSALGQYASLASLAGISIGGGGVFEGDNIIELYKSRQMIEKTLLTPVIYNGKKELLIDRYIDFNKLRSKWQDDKEVGNIIFNSSPDSFTRKQDSIITNIVNTFNKKWLTVSKPDKKLSVIDVELSSKDEFFAKEFSDILVKTVNEFYVKTRIKKTYQTVQILQHQADSVKGMLNSSINGVASAIDAAPNANPAFLTLRVPSQKRQVDVQANTAIYGEIVKNLEIAKINLRQDTPLIQLIDAPVYPLEVDKVSKIKGAILGMLLVTFLTVCTLMLSKFFSFFS